MNRLLPFAAALTLASCASGPTPQQIAASYVGRSETALVQGLGVPSRTYETGGFKFIAYERRSTEVLPAAYPGPFGYYGWYGPPPPSTVIEQVCEMTFQLRESRVLAFALHGNAC